MESSSENSFVWSDASPDTSDVDEMAKSKEVPQSDVESEYGQSYKKKLHRELFANGDDEVSDDKPEKSRKRKIKTEESNDIDSPIRKKIKVEPESDAEPTKKSKRKKSVNEDFLHDDSTYDESYLNLRVKQEETFTAPTEKPKKKKRKSESIVNNYDNEVDTDNKTDLSLEESIETNNHNHTADSEDNESRSKKKKKKSKKKRHSENETPIEDDNLIEDGKPIEEKFTAEETIVETRRSNNKNVSESHDENSHQENVDRRKKSVTTEHSESEEQEMNEHQNSHSISTIDYEPTLSKKKTGRTISERIRFEDEESDVDVRKVVKDQPRKLRNYLKANVHLKPAVHKLNKDAAVTSDDEIFIIKCPNDIDTAAFQGIKLNLDKKCKIKISEKTYEGYLEEEQNKISLLTMNNNKTIVKPVSVSGLLCLRRRVPKSHIREENYMVNNQTNFIPLPETKCRHPLFGANYKKAIKIPSHVVERLQESHVPEEVEIEKVKKKKKKKDKVKSEDTHVEEIPNEIEAEEIPVKKSKKRKHTEEKEEVRPKKSKKKHNLDTAEAWETEKAIEESLFNF